MAEMQLKTIPVNQILANFSQPREQFDRAKIKELAESILGNGLINPIAVRGWKNGKYMIVSGERRWQAYKIAGLKNIQTFVKEYKDDVDWEIESLVENLQREDLTSKEREDFMYKIWKTGKFKSQIELAKKLGSGSAVIQTLISSKQEREKLSLAPKDKSKFSSETLMSVKPLEKKDKEKVLKKILSGSIPSGKDSVREVVRAIKKAPKEISGALLSDEISVEQAENLSKIHSDKARQKALEQTKQHRHIADITPKLMERAKPELTDAVKKQFDTAQRKIFTYLNDAKTSLSKVNKNMKDANMMLTQLMSKSFEYGLPKRTLIVSMQQLKSISDKISEFEIQTDKFDDLKDTFLERVENKLEEE